MGWVELMTFGASSAFVGICVDILLLTCVLHAEPSACRVNSLPCTSYMYWQCQFDSMWVTCELILVLHNGTSKPWLSVYKQMLFSVLPQMLSYVLVLAACSHVYKHLLVILTSHTGGGQSAHLPDTVLTSPQRKCQPFLRRTESTWWQRYSPHMHTLLNQRRFWGMKKSIVVYSDLR